APGGRRGGQRLLVHPGGGGHRQLQPRPGAHRLLSSHWGSGASGALTLAGVSIYISYSHLAFAETAASTGRSTCRASASASAGPRPWPGARAPWRRSAAPSCSRLPGPSARQSPPTLWLSESQQV
ncbi:transmembrane protein 235 isoform 3 precursor, partial [Daubentonia madagascariensis]